MADRVVSLERAALLALVLVGGAMPAKARAHRAAATHHAVTHHATAHHTTTKRTGRHATKPVEHRGVTPAGVTSVPAGGLKIYCPARKSPLLIRKSTQGAGTTVTAVCR